MPVHCRSCSVRPAPSWPPGGSMVLGNHGRGFTAAVSGPLAHVLVRLRVRPKLVTVIGTDDTSTTALLLLPAGHLVIGVLAVQVLAFADSVDGLMARELGQETAFGAYLDSTMDRITDAAIFTALGLYLLGQDEQRWQGTGHATG